jgi:micrococcal nuclease
MKYLVTIFMAVFASTSLKAQKPIELSEASKHVGDSVRVCGKVYGGRYLSSSTGQPTLLNMGGHYPDHLLTLVIWGKQERTLMVHRKKRT